MVPAIAFFPLGVPVLVPTPIPQPLTQQMQSNSDPNYLSGGQSVQQQQQQLPPRFQYPRPVNHQQPFLPDNNRRYVRVIRREVNVHNNNQLDVAANNNNNAIGNNNNNNNNVRMRRRRVIMYRISVRNLLQFVILMIIFYTCCTRETFILILALGILVYFAAGPIRRIMSYLSVTRNENRNFHLTVLHEVAAIVLGFVSSLFPGWNIDHQDAVAFEEAQDIVNQ